MVYIFVIVILLFLMYHYDYRGHSRGRKAWYIFIVVYLMLLAGLRYRIGGDTINYATNHYTIFPDLYEYWQYDFTNASYNRGYLFLNAIALTISHNFVAMQIILAIFVNGVIFRFFYKNTSKIFSAVLFYFLLSYLGLNMEVLRESCAVAMFLLGWEYFWKEKWIKYYLCCIIAVSFHSGALFTFILPLFTLKCLKKAFTPSWLSLGIAIGLFILGAVVMSKFFDVVRLIGLATLDDYASTYENSKFGEARDFNIFGILVFLLKTLSLPFLLGLIVSKKMVIENDWRSKNNQYQNALMVMFITSIYISCISNYVIILGRFSSYLSFFLILIYTETIFHKIRFRNRVYRLSYIIWMGIVFPTLFFPVYGLFQDTGLSGSAPIHKYYPYYSVIDPQLDRERELVIKYTYGF